MDKFLHPERFEYDPSGTGSDKQYTHWLRTFENFISAITTQEIMWHQVYMKTLPIVICMNPQ